MYLVIVGKTHILHAQYRIYKPNRGFIESTKNGDLTAVRLTIFRSNESQKLMILLVDQQRYQPEGGECTVYQLRLQAEVELLSNEF